jgi:hypothetical protein
MQNDFCNNIGQKETVVSTKLNREGDHSTCYVKCVTARRFAELERGQARGQRLHRPHGLDCFDYFG